MIWRGCKVKNAKDREIQHSSWPCSSFSFFAVCGSLVIHHSSLPCFRWSIAYRGRNYSMLILSHSPKHIILLHLIKKNNQFLWGFVLYGIHGLHNTEQLYLTTLLWRKGHLGNEAAHNQRWHCEHGQHKWVSILVYHKWLFEEHSAFYNISFVHR